MKRDANQAFIWLVYAFVAFVWLMSYRQIAWPIPFTLLLVLYGIGYSLMWRAVLLIQYRILFLAVQTLLAAGLVLMAGHSALVIALFFPLVGVTFGLFPSVAGRLLAVGGVLLVWAGAVWLGGDRQMLMQLLPSSAISLLFVGVYVVLFNRQMLERQLAERLADELAAANRRLQSYAVRVEELTITEERQRMARELHDTLAQGLAGLVMQLEAVDDLLSRGESERAQAITGRAMQRARTTLAEARTAIAALRTPLEQGNVVSAIEQLVATLRKESGISCVLEVGPGDLPVKGNTGEQLYRIVRECLTNIQRHAHASQVSVQLSAVASAVRLTVTDNGVGFNPTAVPAEHFGLMGIQERVRLLGGTCQIESAPGAGTRIQIVLPVPAEEAK
ncbi:MAG: ATP-binding protein [Mycobacterium leprae]